jgi:Flp pilus assembly protein TadG
MLTFLQSCRRRLRAFLRDRAGNVAMTFGIATIPLIGSVGAAIDFSQANSVKASMQVALDTTALMLSRDAATLSNADLQLKAKNYFTAVFTRPEATNIVVSAAYQSSGGSQVTVNASTKVPTTFMGILGYESMTLTGSSVSKWGSERLRVALALDNTGSMDDDGKMAALKSATKSLLLQLKNAASTNGDVYVSIIPFAKDVNIGASNYTQTYITWTQWDAANVYCSGGWGSSCSGGTWKTANHNTWNGCITDRGGSSGPSSSDYDQKVTLPGTSSSSKYPAEQDSGCPVQMQGLTYDWSGLNSLVDSMTPNGSTNQPIGLVWAWQSLVGGGPLTAPAKDTGYTYKEIVILMSDGLNTKDRWYGNGSSVSTSVDRRMYDTDGSGTCANIKAAGITIYSIQVNTGGDPTSTIMKNCASAADKFYEVKVGTVFTAIGTNLTKLRVAQ